VDTPRQRPFRHATVGQAGLNPMYHQLSHGEGVGRYDWLLVRVVSTCADMMPTRRSTTLNAAGDRRVGQQSPSARRPPTPSPGPIRVLLGPLPDTGSDSDVPNLLASHQEG
jgi:hypothetical protein